MLLTLLPFLVSVEAFFILSQPILLNTRLDPIVDPGRVSGHVHTIAGGSNFDKAMTYESMQASTCTTAPITVDKSNYWIPQLYYYNPKTTGYQAIPAAYVNTYYLPRGGTNDTIRAFPDGLRMISGDPNRRDFDAKDVNDQAISYVCLDYAGGHQGDPAWAQRNDFFKHNCPDGLRAQVNFPTCWNGKDLDSPDHRSHMAWPIGANNNGGGNCPASHPVKVVQLFYEFIFEVQKFPFNAEGPTWVFANGDATGYGLHADFVNGWPRLINGTNVLQRAINECNANNGVGGNLQDCPPFAGLINNAAAQGCRPQNPLVAEDIGFGHEIPVLPGNNPLWIGNMTKPTNANYTEGNTSYVDPRSVMPANWSYVGCIAESVNGRALDAYVLSSANMTRAVCAAECERRGYPLSGTQFGQECYCDSAMKNGASNTTLLPTERCNVRCAANSYESCGGSRTLSLYRNTQLYIPVANPVIPAGLGGWFKKTRNCVAEPSGRRALTGYTTANGQMTPVACMNLCQARGYAFAGTEWSSECYCGSSVDAGALEAVSTDCDKPCAGKPDEMCGGGQRLNMYFFNQTTPIKPTLPQDWVATGCWNGQATAGRAFTGPLVANNSMTNDICMLECQSKGFVLASVEYGKECRCAQEFAAGSVQAPATDCSMSCAGNPAQMCGAGGRMTTFKFTGKVAAPIAPNNTDIRVAGWTHSGCFTEGSPGRALTRYSFASNTMTIPTCLAACAARGWKYGGVEYGQECYCGDTLANGARAATDGCTMVCPGDKMTLCGGSSRLNIFESTAPPSTTTSSSTSTTTTTSTTTKSTTTATTTKPTTTATVPTTTPITPAAPTSAATWVYRGCYTEGSGVRAVPNGSYKSSSPMDRATCQAIAEQNNHTWAALVYGRECFTGVGLNPKSNSTLDAECNFTCDGSKTGEKCGGNNRASVLQNTKGAKAKRGGRWSRSGRMARRISWEE